MDTFRARLELDDEGLLTLVVRLGPVESPRAAGAVPPELAGDHERLLAAWRIDLAEARAEKDLAEAEYRSIRGF